MCRIALRLAWLAAPCLTLAADGAWARPRPPVPTSIPAASALCRNAILQAERVGHIPERLMDAIAVVESGRRDPVSGAVYPWPWTINAEGVGHFYESKAEAIAAVQTLQARGVTSIDTGCMQVNLMHHPDAFASLDAAFDPQANASYAARFLRVLYDQTYAWPLAAAAYHSFTPDLGADYARKVLAAWGVPQAPSGAAMVDPGSEGVPVNGRRAAIMPPNGAMPVRGMPVVPHAAMSASMPAAGATPGNGRGLDFYRSFPVRLALRMPRAG